MAITNNERVGRALEFLRAGLRPFVEREMRAIYKDRWVQTAISALPAWQSAKPGEINLDVQALLTITWDSWNDVFKKTLGPAERSLVSELRDIRNRHAHQKTFSGDDTYRALDSTERLLNAITAAEQAEAVRQMKDELMRLRYEEQLRGEKRKEAAAAVVGRPADGLPAWRDIITPHPDVSSGKYARAEFAADLWQVFQGEGIDEYLDPVEFYRRTYITEGLKSLLSNALVRLNGQGGDAVVELQTNFGGGKTHSMLALYHLCGSANTPSLPGMDVVVQVARLSRPPAVKRAVLVGQKISPAVVHSKADGTHVRTLWGELAWQLGGKAGYDMVRQADEKGVAPGDLTPLLKRFEPCLILVDEWIAYARQLYSKSDLPAGDFDAHFTFAQALSESAKNATKTLLVVSIPASDNEIGGEGGREALKRLKNVLHRVETVWRPASSEESFEIVRRRLFKPIETDKYKQRDLVVAKFAEEYRRNPQEYPAEASKPDYEKRLRNAYPIHPELFDRLYKDWGTLDKFQLTRGVLRLLASVVHTLWEKNDRGLLILPASVPMDDHQVVSELTKYLEDNWRPVIEQDVDGPESVPLRLDRDNNLFGRFSASRRVARSLYLGSAPKTHAANKGLEDKEIKLASVQPGESSGTFGDALRKLADQATHLYVEGNRYWFSTRPSLNRIAEERATNRHAEDVWEEVRTRLHKETQRRGELRAQPCPAGPSDVPDEQDARLVILGPDKPFDIKSNPNPAQAAAQEILERGGYGRQYLNSLVFLAADRARLTELEQSIRQYQAWTSIQDDSSLLDLTDAQKAQAKKRCEDAERAIEQRLPETYSVLLAPTQRDKNDPIAWDNKRVKGTGNLVERAVAKLQEEVWLVTKNWSGTLLRMELDKVPLWRGDHVAVKQLWEDFSKYVYLQRLKNSEVLLSAIMDGVRLFSTEGLAYADSWDESTGRYRGLKTAGQSVSPLMSGIVLMPEVASAQAAKEEVAKQANGERNLGAGTGSSGPTDRSLPLISGGNGPEKKLRRFYGSVNLDPIRISRDVAKVAEEVIQHLIALDKANVSIRLELEASTPEGVPDDIFRTILENCRTLKFTAADFEES